MRFLPPKFLYYLLANVLLAIYLSTKTGSMGFESTISTNIVVGAINLLFSTALTALPFILFLVLEILFSKDHSISELIIFLMFCLLIVGLIKFLPSRYIYRYIQCVTEGCDDQRLYEE